MINFKELGIKPELKSFTGDKIKIDRLLNREIVIHDFKVDNSKFEKGDGKCLQLQIEISGNMHVVFTGSVVLRNMIEQVDKKYFPFTTTIIKTNDHYEFT